MSLRDTAMFAFNIVSAMVFTALALFFSPEFWPFICYVVLAAVACVAAFVHEWRRHPGRTTRRPTIMIPKNTSVWSAGGVIFFLFLYAAILVYPAFLFNAVLISIFGVPDPLTEFGRFLARVAARGRVQR